SSLVNRTHRGSTGRRKECCSTLPPGHWSIRLDRGRSAHDQRGESGRGDADCQFSPRYFSSGDAGAASMDRAIAFWSLGPEELTIGSSPKPDEYADDLRLLPIDRSDRRCSWGIALRLRTAVHRFPKDGRFCPRGHSK